MGLLVVLVILAGMAAILLIRSKPPQEMEGLVYEVNTVTGDIPDESKTERQKELDSIVEEGMLTMSIDAVPSGKDTGSDQSVSWLIENPSNQGKLIRVEIYRDGTGEKTCETGAIKPGSYVESTSPGVGPPVGEYNYTARFYIHRLKTEEYIGQAVVKIGLVIYERKGQIWRKRGKSLEK